MYYCKECIEAYWCRAAAANKGRSSSLKEQRKRKTDREEKEKREAVRAGKRVICSQLSCAGGRVEARRGTDERMNCRTRGRRAPRLRSFRSESEHEPKVPS